MKGIILAAGQGVRLSPLTDDKPKCMVEYNNKMIIDYILDSMTACGVTEQIIVNGYKKEVLENHVEQRNVVTYSNEKFASSNMVSTLFCAEHEMNDEIVISYADIIYKNEVLQALLDSTADIACVVDTKWKELWLQRMDNPLDDAETMKIDKDENIVELGKKPQGYSDIEAQYIGLIKVSSKALPLIRDFYHSLDKKADYDGKDFDNMYMTSFLQMIIDKLMPIQAVRINGGWLEIDSVSDLKSVTCT